MAKKNVSFGIEESDLKQIDQYAKNADRDRSYVLNQAVKMFILATEAEGRDLDEASAAIDRGEGIPIEEAFAAYQQKKAERKAS